MGNLVTCNPKGNRQRWPELAETVDQMRTFFPEVSVLNIVENGRLVAGNRLEFAADKPGEPKCNCGCIPPFCSCPPHDGQVTTAGVR